MTQTRRCVEERLTEKLKVTVGGWERVISAVVETAKEVCGESRGKRHHERTLWWWCEKVQQAIKEKKEAYKVWQGERTEDSKRSYREKKSRARREVAVAKRQAWEQWSQNINTAEGRKKMFRIAKQVKKYRKDVVGARYTKDEAGNLQVDEAKIMQRWKRYFSELLNEENQFERDEQSMVEGPIMGVKSSDVKEALHKMKCGKARGPSGVTSDLLKWAGEVGVQELTKIFQSIEKEGKMPSEWDNSYTIPVFKGKGDALLCGKYRGVRLLEHGMKLWEKILERRLKEVIEIDENQFGFQQGKSTTDAILVVRQLQEKYGEKRKLYHVFVDLEKAFDRVPREMIVWALRRQKVPENLIILVLALYENTRSRVKSLAGLSEEFSIEVGVNQGSALSPLVMQEATKEERGENLKELLYADDLVLMADDLME